MHDVTIINIPNLVPVLTELALDSVDAKQVLEPHGVRINNLILDTLNLK